MAGSSKSQIASISIQRSSPHQFLHSAALTDRPKSSHSDLPTLTKSATSISTSIASGSSVGTPSIKPRVVAMANTKARRESIVIEDYDDDASQTYSSEGALSPSALQFTLPKRSRQDASAVNSLRSSSPARLSPAAPRSSLHAPTNGTIARPYRSTTAQSRRQLDHITSRLRPQAPVDGYGEGAEKEVKVKQEAKRIKDEARQFHDKFDRQLKNKIIPNDEDERFQDAYEDGNQDQDMRDDDKVAGSSSNMFMNSDPKPGSKRGRDIFDDSESDRTLKRTRHVVDSIDDARLNSTPNRSRGRSPEVVIPIRTPGDHHPPPKPPGPALKATPSRARQLKHKLVSTGKLRDVPGPASAAAYRKRALPEHDPENHTIKTLRQDKKMSWMQIAAIVNKERIERGEEPSMTGAAVYGRFVRNAPRIAAMKGEPNFDKDDYMFLKTHANPSSFDDFTRRGRGGGATSNGDGGNSKRRRPTQWTEELEEALVLSVQRTKAELWMYVVSRMRVSYGIELTTEECAKKFALL